MSVWIDVDDCSPPVGVLVRLKLRDTGGEFESPHPASMDENGEYYNRHVDPSVLVKPLVVAWRPIRPRRVAP